MFYGLIFFYSPITNTTFLLIQIWLFQMSIVIFLCSNTQEYQANICIQLFRSHIHLYSIFNIQDDESLASLRKDHQYVACHLSFNVVWCFKHMLQIIYNYVWQQISAIIYNIWSLNKVNEQKIDNQLRKNEILWWVVSPQ